MKYAIIFYFFGLSILCDSCTGDKYFYIPKDVKLNYKSGDSIKFISKTSNEFFILSIDSIHCGFEEISLEHIFGGSEYYEIIIYYQSTNGRYCGLIRTDYWNQLYITYFGQFFDNGSNEYIYDSLYHSGIVYHNVYLLNGHLPDTLNSVVYNQNSGILEFNFESDTFYIEK